MKCELYGGDNDERTIGKCILQHVKILCITICNDDVHINMLHYFTIQYINYIVVHTLRRSIL